MYSFGTWNSGDPFLKSKQKPTLNLNPNYTVTNPNNRITQLPTSIYKPFNYTASQPNMTSKVFNLINPPTNYSTEPPVTRRTFRPEDLKVNLLEEKVRQLQTQNNIEKQKYNDIIRSGILKRQELQKDFENNMRNNYDNIPLNIKSRNDKKSEQEYNKRRLDRRNQVRFELEEARKKLHSSSSEYSDEEEENEENESGLKNNQRNINVNQRKQNKQESEDLLFNIRNGYQRTNSISSTKVNSEALDFIDSIRNHPAFQLQADNFKLRANVSYLQNSFREIQEIMREKITQLELQQKLNFESMRYVLEKGGGNKLKASVLKNLDKKNINLEDVAEEIPDFINDLPDLIDTKLEENEKRRKEEEIREKIEENELRNYDEVYLPPIVTGIVNGEAQNINPNRVNYPKFMTNAFGYPKEEEERRRGSVIDNFKQVVSPKRGSIGPTLFDQDKGIINLNKIEYSNSTSISKSSQSKSKSSQSKSSQSQSKSSQSESESKFNKKNKKKNKKDSDESKSESESENKSEESEDDDDENDKRRNKKNKNKKGKKKIYKLASGKKEKKKNNKKRIRKSIPEDENESDDD